VKKWLAEVIREMFDVPNCRSVIRLDKEIRRPGQEPVLETRYYISSLDPDKVPASSVPRVHFGTLGSGELSSWAEGSFL